LILGISDLKGIKEISPLQIAGANVDFEPGIPASNLSLGFGSSTVAEKQVATKEKTGSLFGQGMNAKMTFDEKDSPIYSDSLPFSMSMKLNGSQGFYVVPVGKVTKVHLTSDWTSPGFDGNFLPDSRQIDQNGFTADWKILDINRSYGQIINGDDDASMRQNGRLAFRRSVCPVGRSISAKYARREIWHPHYFAHFCSRITSWNRSEKCSASVPVSAHWACLGTVLFVVAFAFGSIGIRSGILYRRRNDGSALFQFTCRASSEAQNKVGSWAPCLLFYMHLFHC